jgi:hypothetical protein
MSGRWKSANPRRHLERSQDLLTGHPSNDPEALWPADDAARELPNLPLEDPLQLVHLYAERGSPKYEPLRCAG